MNVKLKQFAQSGATDGQVCAWNNSAQKWEPTTNGLTAASHRALDQLVHEISETSYDEPSYTGKRIDSYIVWTTSGKTKKIREELYTYTGKLVTQVVRKHYDGDGVLITGETDTHVLDYTGKQVTSVTRTVT
jgi:hypothetical protein